MNSNRISRRRILQATLATTLGSGVISELSNNLLLAENSARSIRGLDDSAAQLIPGKDKRLIVLAPDPAVIETPLSLLYESKITPESLLFVRNNQQPKEMATLKPVAADDWKVQIQGKSITVGQLKELPQSSVTMVLQCSGNGRSLFSKAAQTKGTQWGKGGMGCVKIGGVRLSDVLNKLGLEPDESHRYVLAKGVDKPAPKKEDFLHTLPLDEVVNRSILALSLNDNSLPAIHGGPVRLVTPGVYATMHIKWLESLSFVTEESDNYNHVPRYRVPKSPIKPGTDFQFKLSNSNYNWNMKVKTVVLNLEDGQQSPAGRLAVQGVAFNDGSAPIESVLVSANKGRSWKPARLEKPDHPLAWTRFESSFQLEAGRYEIWTRAVDAFGRSQPLNGAVAWNPRGYEWNGVEKIKVELV